MILVLNLGLKSVRCIAFSFDGTVAAQCSNPVQTFVNDRRVEQNPGEWLEKSHHVIKAVTGSLADKRRDIKYLTITTSASCLVPVDAEGNPLCNSLLVSDTRSHEEAQMLKHIIEFQKVYHETGTKSSPDLMLPKILWLKKYEPEIFAKTRCFLNVGDFLLHDLVGDFFTDESNALKYHYVVAAESYPESLLRSLGIDVTTLPKVCKIGTEVGKILRSKCQQLDLPAQCRVILSTYDALAAVAGTGTFKLGEAVDVSGTVTSFRAVTEHHLYDPQDRIHVTPHFVEGQWLAGGSNNLGGGVIEWLRQLLFSESPSAYDEMEDIATNELPCPGGLIFLPYLLGERTPLWDPDCRGVFFGLNRAHTKRQMAKAVLEGVAFSTRDIATVVQSFQIDIKEVTVSGGLARLDAINQIKSDVLGVPIKKLANFESTAIGAALIAMAGAGDLNNPEEGFERFCAIDRVFEPDRNKTEIYNEYFEIFKATYHSLKDVFAARANIFKRRANEGYNELTLTENL